MTLLESILHYNPTINAPQLISLETLRPLVNKFGIEYRKSDGVGKLQLELFEKTVEKHLLKPTFITSYPKEVSPFARCNDNNPMVCDRFELFIGGREIANGFSEHSMTQKNKLGACDSKRPTKKRVISKQ